MNAQEIYNKRIEEAAKRYSWSHDTIGVDKETFHTEASQKHPIPIDKHVRVPIQHEMEVAFKCAAHFILKNQWISVEEALPEDKTKVFVIVKTPVGIVHRADYHINDYWYMSRYSPEEIVTHWMPIPSLEGGEK